MYATLITVSKTRMSWNISLASCPAECSPPDAKARPGDIIHKAMKSCKSRGSNFPGGELLTICVMERVGFMFIRIYKCPDLVAARYTQAHPVLWQGVRVTSRGGS